MNQYTWWSPTLITSKRVFRISLGNHHTIWAPKPLLSAESISTPTHHILWMVRLVGKGFTSLDFLLHSQRLLCSTTTVSNHGILWRLTHSKHGHQVELLMIYLGSAFKRILGVQREFRLSLLLFRVSCWPRMKSLAKPFQQAIFSHLEVSPEGKATGTCNTIVKVRTINGSRLVAQNTESEVIST